jgi:hypothetical protein
MSSFTEAGDGDATWGLAAIEILLGDSSDYKAEATCIPPMCAFTSTSSM